MSILKQYLEYEEYEEHYSSVEREKIRAEFLKDCRERINQLKNK